MQFPTLLVIAALATNVISSPLATTNTVTTRTIEKRRLHKLGYCRNDADTWNDKATSESCAAYRQRNTGSSQWDKCPDCHYDGGLCLSKDKHIGGDEWYAYCIKFGAQESTAEP